MSLFGSTGIGIDFDDKAEGLCTRLGVSNKHGGLFGCVQSGLLQGTDSKEATRVISSGRCNDTMMQ